MNEIREEYAETMRERRATANSTRAETFARGMRNTRARDQGVSAPVNSISLNRPVTWEELTCISKSVQEEYLYNCRVKYKGRVKDIAAMLGLHPVYLGHIMPWVEGSTYRGRTMSPEWCAFINTGKVEASPEEPTPEPAPEPAPEPTPDFSIESILRALRDGGVKITITVSLGDAK